MNTTKYDAIIIGTGQAGPTLSSKLAAAGWKTAIIEANKFGGTCVNDGCTPTKTLVASARTAYVARNAARYGVMIDGDIQVDMKKVKARKDEEVNKSTTGVEKWLKSTENLTVYEGKARFESNKVVAVNGERLESDKIFINVGGRPFVPPGFHNVPHLTNTSIMDLDYVPDHLVVIGGSYIGLEFGQMYRRFGSKVTIIEMGPRLVGREDEDVSAGIQQILEEEGIDVRTESTCLDGVRLEDGRVLINVDCEKGDREVYTRHLLVATGRRPNTDDLGLENTDIKTNQRGYIEVDDFCKTNVEGIWALGDVNGRGAFTHTSYNDYEIVAANLLDNDPRKISDRIQCYALYTDPALARIGMSEKEVKAAGIPALKGERTMQRIARAREKGETKGFMKILVHAETKKILGATILGIEGDEVIHSLLDVMYADAPYTVVSRAVHIHPTVSELIPTVLQGLQPLE